MDPSTRARSAGSSFAGKYHKQVKSGLGPTVAVIVYLAIVVVIAILIIVYYNKIVGACPAAKANMHHLILGVFLTLVIGFVGLFIAAMIGKKIKSKRETQQ